MRRARVDGRAVEREWVEVLRRRGVNVIPLFDFLRNNDATTAPMLSGVAGLTVLPDCLAFAGASRPQMWTEVKAKHEPGHRRDRGRWEHGCDFRKWEEYREIARLTPGWDFYIVVWERLSPAPGRQLVERPGGTWLYGKFRELNSKGTFEGGWPDSARAKQTRGGWLWPRCAMDELRPQLAFPGVTDGL